MAFSVVGHCEYMAIAVNDELLSMANNCGESEQKVQELKDSTLEKLSLCCFCQFLACMCCGKSNAAVDVFAVVAVVVPASIAAVAVACVGATCMAGCFCCCNCLRCGGFGFLLLLLLQLLHWYYSLPQMWPWHWSSPLTAAAA